VWGRISGHRLISILRIQFRSGVLLKLLRDLPREPLLFPPVVGYLSSRAPEFVCFAPLPRSSFTVSPSTVLFLPPFPPPPPKTPLSIVLGHPVFHSLRHFLLSALCFPPGSPLPLCISLPADSFPILLLLPAPIPLSYPLNPSATPGLAPFCRGLLISGQRGTGLKLPIATSTSKQCAGFRLSPAWLQFFPDSPSFSLLLDINFIVSLSPFHPSDHSVQFFWFLRHFNATILSFLLFPFLLILTSRGVVSYVRFSIDTLSEKTGSFYRRPNDFLVFFFLSFRVFRLPSFGCLSA